MEVKQTHCGQYERYGDFYRVWEITTDAYEEEVKAHCLSELAKKDNLPTEAQWRADIRYPDGAHCNDARFYFRGYYKLEKTSSGYTFTVCEPYAD